MANLSAKLLIVVLVFGCSHQLKHEQKLDITTVKDEARKTNTHRGPVRYIAPYTDAAGNPHPAVVERGAVDTTSIYTGHFLSDTHWYDFLRTSWKLGLPWWIWILGSFGAVLVLIYVFHHFTIIGRIQALWSKFRAATSNSNSHP